MEIKKCSWQIVFRTLLKALSLKVSSSILALLYKVKTLKRHLFKKTFGRAKTEKAYLFNLDETIHFNYHLECTLGIKGIRIQTYCGGC